MEDFLGFALGDPELLMLRDKLVGNHIVLRVMTWKRRCAEMS